MAERGWKGIHLLGFEWVQIGVQGLEYSLFRLKDVPSKDQFSLLYALLFRSLSPCLWFSSLISLCFCCTVPWYCSPLGQKAHHHYKCSIGDDITGKILWKVNWKKNYYLIRYIIDRTLRALWLVESPCFIRDYTINQVTLAFWLVLAYDLLEDKYTIDVITTKFLLYFKMAESFEK